MAFIKTQVLTLSLLALAFILPQNQAFIVSGGPETRPLLTEFARKHAQEGIPLNVRLDIPENVFDAKSSHLYIKDLMVRLRNDLGPTENFASLPKIDGPAVVLRTGPLGLETESSGNFISIKGTEQVSLANGSWEMLWLEKKAAGSIVLAFDLDHNVRRNDAILKSGGVYISFPVFTIEGLKAMREERKEFEDTMQLHIDTEAQELKIVNETKNLFTKALHFRRAVVANEKFMRMRAIGAADVPSKDEDLMQVGEDLVIFSKGSVWSKESKRPNCLFVGKAALKM